jgi:hypothetical protein
MRWTADLKSGRIGPEASRRAAQLAGAVVLIGIVIVWLWAWWPQAAFSGPAAGATPASAPGPDPFQRMVHASTWMIPGWVEPEAVVTTQAPVQALNVVSIMEVGGVFTAALDVGGDQGLVFASTGMRVSGVEVVEITTAGVRVRTASGLRFLPVGGAP